MPTESADSSFPTQNRSMEDDAAIPVPNRPRGGSILLSLKPHFTDSRNATTAVAESEDGCTVAVTLWVADPPQLSLFSVSCTMPESTERCYFSVNPHVVGADGPFVLIRAVLDSGFPRRREYFLYKAADPPSLDPIPCPDEIDDLRRIKELGIVGLGHGYLLAALGDAPRDDDDGYQLRIYSSETRSWSTRALRNPCPGVDRVIPDKVITLGTQGLLGWVDLSQGILVCDLSLLPPLQQQDQDPTSFFYFIPLPDRLPGNKYKLKYPIPPAKKVKDEHHLREETPPSSSWFRDLTCVNGALKFIEMENPLPQNKEDNVRYVPDLIMLLKRKAIDGNPKKQLSCFRDDWRAVTWTLNLGSSSSPPSNCWRQASAAHVAAIKEGQQLRGWYSAFPILSPEEDGDDDILYLRSLLEPSDPEGSLVALDIRNKSLIGQYYIPEEFRYRAVYDTDHPYRACTLSRHLDMTAPGIQVSEYRKTADKPRKTSIRMSTSQRINALQAITGTKIKRAQSNSLDYTPGPSLLANQNNLAPQQWFNFIKPDGPGFSSLDPVHGHHNYQPQLLTSSSDSGPHEAPQPCFTRSDGASYSGYPQQLLASKPFAFGAHTGFGNYQHHWHQFPSTVELPSGTSWQHPPPLVQHQQHLTP